MPITTKNLELYFQHAPTANLTTLAALSTVGMVNGVIIEVISDGIFTLQTPAVAIADGRDVITGSGGGVWIRKTLPALTTTAVGGAITIAKGGTGEVSQQAAIDSLAGAVTSTYYLRGNGTHAVMNTIQAGDVPTLNQNTSGTAAKATNIVGGDANHLPYQTATDVTNFIADANDAVLVTSNAGVPSLSTTLPAVEAGACTCTDPTTTSSASIDTALSNVYSAVIPPESYVVNVSSVSLDPTSIVPQIITGAQLSLPIGKYLISYSSSQTCTPTATNTGATCTSIPYLYNSTTGFDIDDTASSALVGKAITGAEIFGGTGSLTTIQTFVIPTTIDVYVQINNLIGAGATLVADETTITAVRLANTQATYSAAAPLVADSTSTSPQIVTGAQLVLPAGKYLLTYSTSQSLITKVADATTAFEAKSYIYNTTGAAIVANTEYITFSGYAETGAEIFGGTSSATVVVTLGVTTTLDVYVQLSAATDAADTYAVAAEISAVKLD